MHGPGRVRFDESYLSGLVVAVPSRCGRPAVPLLPAVVCGPLESPRSKAYATHNHNRRCCYSKHRNRYVLYQRRWHRTIETKWRSVPKVGALLSQRRVFCLFVGRPRSPARLLLQLFSFTSCFLLNYGHLFILVRQLEFLLGSLHTNDFFFWFSLFHL